MRIEAESLNQKIKLMRASNGDTQDDLAEAVNAMFPDLDISRNIIQRLEMDESRPHHISEEDADWRVLLALSVHWGVALSDLSGVAFENSRRVGVLLQKSK